MFKPVVSAFIFSSCCLISAAAQEVVQQIAPAPPEMGIVALDPISIGQVVRDAPYTAEAITEVTQMLSDGNRIEHRTSANVARDGQGRTRREQQAIAFGAFVAKNEQPVVTITDPDGSFITLNYDLKVAFRAKPPKVPPFENRVEAFAGPTLEMSLPGEPMAAGIVKGVKGSVMASAGFAPMMNDEWTVREPLEAKILEGVKVEGARRTLTIPAGVVGNVQPLAIVFEQWYSPELQVIVMSRRSDPRFGETLYRLTNIQRAEPSPELFRIPADFRIEDLRPGAMMPVRPNGA